MHHVAGFELEARRDERASPVGQPPMSRHAASSSGTGGAMDGAVDAAAAGEAAVGGGDQHLDIEPV